MDNFIKKLRDISKTEKCSASLSVREDELFLIVCDLDGKASEYAIVDCDSSEEAILKAIEDLMRKAKGAINEK